MNTYLIQLQGQVDVNDLNPLSPHRMTDVQVRSTTTRFAVCTDQSGLLGMLRFLHDRGLAFLALRQVA